MMRAKRLMALPLAAVVLMALLACKKDKEGEKTGATSAAAAGGDIGVPECDDYLKKYEKCLEKMPEAARGSMKTGLETMRTSWKQAASNPASKAALGQGCKQALETAKTSMGAYGCEW